MLLWCTEDTFRGSEFFVERGVRGILFFVFVFSRLGSFNDNVNYVGGG